MRIISGLLKNRRFEVPDGELRPTMERTREAVFSSLGALIPGARVLDLFAGSGGYGLEAWSRGAAEVVAVEGVSSHWQTLQKNFEALDGDGLGAWKAVQGDVYRFTERKQKPFDLIFADPPYDAVDLPKLLVGVGRLLASDGLLVFEMRSSEDYILPSGWSLIREKKYGEARELFLESINE